MTEFNPKKLKQKFVLLYARVSTPEQVKTLPKQLSILKKYVKDNKIKGKIIEFSEQISGTSKAPEQWIKLVNFALSKPKGDCLVVVRDFQRISRNWRYGGKNMVDLYEHDVPVVSVIRNTISATEDNLTTDDWLIGLYMALGAQEVDALKLRTGKGTQASEEEGIVSGSFRDFFPKETMNPYRELDRYLKEGMGQNEASRKLGRSTSWFQKTRRFYNEVRERGGDKLLEEWLKLSDKMRAYEVKHRFGKTKEEAKILRAIYRKTSGFVKRPYDFPIPTDEMLNEYEMNFEKYQPKRSK